MEILDSGIEVYGVSEHIPRDPYYFKEFEFQINKKTDNIMMEKILSINVNIDVESVDIIKTPTMISDKGEFFSGYKLKVELIISAKIKYMVGNTLGLIKENSIKTIYIVLPLEHEKINMVDLLRKKRIIVNSYIEDIYVELREEDIIYINLSAIVIANFNDNNYAYNK